MTDDEGKNPYPEGDIVTDAGPSPTLAETVPQSRAAYGKLMKNRKFRLLWISQFVSGIGDWLVIGLLMPLVLELSHGSSFAVAGIMIAKIIPSLVLSSFTGVFVDRFDRRRLMIACDLARAFLTIGLVFTRSLWAIYGIVLLMEIASLFFYPAKSAYIPYLVDEEDVALANGLSYTTQQGSMLVGLTAASAILATFEVFVRWVLVHKIPLVTAFVLHYQAELIGPRAGVFVDCFTFLFSAAVITLIAVPAKAEREGGLDWSLIGKDVVESFQFLLGHRELRGFLTTIGLAILGGGAIIPVGLNYVDQNLVRRTAVPITPVIEKVPVLARLLARINAAPSTFMLVFLALGMTAGALLVPKLAERLSLPALFLGGVTAFGLSMLGFSTVSIYWLAIVFAILAGLCIAGVTVAGNTYVIHTVSDDLRGRVFTAMESVIRVGLLVSMIVLAPLGDIIAEGIRRFTAEQGLSLAGYTLTGSRITLQIASLIVLGAAVYAYRTLDWRGEGNGTHA